MTTLSITLPENLAKASQEVAKKLGVSRTELIRQAIAHELENLQLKFEQEAIIKTLNAMKRDSSYLAETEEIIQGLNAELSNDEGNWWSK